jgi:hypothetical protein
MRDALGCSRGETSSDLTFANPASSAGPEQSEGGERSFGRRAAAPVFAAPRFCPTGGTRVVLPPNIRAAMSLVTVHPPSVKEMANASHAHACAEPTPVLHTFPPAIRRTAGRRLALKLCCHAKWLQSTRKCARSAGSRRRTSESWEGEGLSSGAVAERLHRPLN